MATSSGPHNINSDLVFGYDTGYGLVDRGITTRFSKGEPVDNIWYQSYQEDINTRTTFQAPMQSTAGLNQSVRSETWNGNRIWQLDRTAGTAGTYDSWRRCVNQPLASSYSSNRYVAIKICFPFGGSISELALHTGGGNASHNSSQFIKIDSKDVPSDAPYKENWYQFFAPANWTSTTSGHCVGLAFKSGNATTFLATEPMYYASDALVPFTSTVRAHTDTLYDLASRSSITTANASYNNGMLSFDGTDDYISITNPGVSNTQGFTIELVTNPDSYSNSPMVITPQSAGIDHYIRFPSTGKPYMRVVIAADSTVQNFAVTSTLPTGNYTHLVFTYDSTSGGKAYFNGNLEGSGSPNFTAQEWSSSWYIGQRGNNSFYYDGVLPVVKIYNKVLSAQEIQQNFKSYKNRFTL